MDKVDLKKKHEKNYLHFFAIPSSSRHEKVLSIVRKNFLPISMLLLETRGGTEMPHRRKRWGGT
jgi:hypothetical protein